jgi:hypothetical protein
MFDFAVAALVVLADEVQAACTGALILVVAGRPRCSQLKDSPH